MTHLTALRAALAAALVLACAAAPAQSVTDLLKQLPLPGAAGGDAAAAALGNDEIVGGLKQALAKGARRAVKRLGREDGFLGNARVKIPMPEKLQTVETALRTLGQDRYADEFVETMNRAAEAAVPEAGAILGDAIEQMTIEDAKQILDGPEDAATRYFRRVGEDRLRERFRPIVEEATAANGVTGAYKSLTDRAGFAAKALGQESLDVDEYVTGKAMDGLFTMIAAEEKRIRANPAARTTDLLKKVFGQGT